MRSKTLLLIAALSVPCGSCATRARPHHYGRWSAAAPDAAPGEPGRVLGTFDDPPAETSAAQPAPAHDHGGHGAHHAH